MSDKRFWKIVIKKRLKLLPIHKLGALIPELAGFMQVLTLENLRRAVASQATPPPPSTSYVWLWKYEKLTIMQLLCTNICDSMLYLPGILFNIRGSLPPTSRGQSFQALVKVLAATLQPEAGSAVSSLLPDIHKNGNVSENMLYSHTHTHARTHARAHTHTYTCTYFHALWEGGYTQCNLIWFDQKLHIWNEYSRCYAC